MLGKLLKYELKATARTFLPLYGAILVVSIVVRLAFSNFQHAELFMGISALTLFGLFVALAVLTLLVIVQRFNNNLLSDEGYLMFTLPVSTHSLVLSKLFASIIWVIVSVAVSFVAFCVIAVNGVFLSELPSIWSELSALLDKINYQHWLILIQFLAVLLSEFIYFVMTIYTALSVSQIVPSNKHRMLVAFFAFFAMNIVLGSVTGGIFSAFAFTQDFLMSATTALASVNMLFFISILWNLAFGTGLYFVTNYLLKRHLNLE